MRDRFSIDLGNKRDIFCRMFKKVGVLGGGQLGRMMIAPAIDLGAELHFLDPDPTCSVADFTSHLMVGDFKDYDDVLRFGRTVDIITVEIEHVNVEALEVLEGEGKKVFPSSKVLRTIQDKGLQKQFYLDNGIATAPFRLIHTLSDITDFPIVQKTRTGGYDGKGVQILKSQVDLENAFPGETMLEELVDMKRELGVIVARNESGVVSVFPPVAMEFCPKLNLVKYVTCPINIDSEQLQAIELLAKRIAEKLQIVGVLAVELFETQNGKILVNESACRVHNSGHLTIEGATISQFEAHLRAVLNLPLPKIDITKPSVMVNLVGDDVGSGEAALHGTESMLSETGVYMHWYGKRETRPGRKMGHVTVVKPSLEAARALGDEVLKTLKVQPK